MTKIIGMRTIARAAWNPIRMNFFQRLSHTSIETRKASARGLRRLLLDYGPVAFATYTAISCVSFPSWVAAVHFGVDVPAAMRLFSAARNYVAATIPFLDLSAPQTTESDEPEKDSIAYSDFYSKFGATVLVALTAHQLILPLRIGLTAYLTPVAARYRSRIVQAFIRHKSA